MRTEKIIKAFIFLLGALFLSASAFNSYILFSDWNKLFSAKLVTGLGSFPRQEASEPEPEKLDQEQEAGDAPLSLTTVQKPGLEQQLVEHLFDIRHFPSPKAAVFRPDGQEIWVALLLNKDRGVSVLIPKQVKR